MRKKVGSLFLVLALCLAMLPTTVLAAHATGSCGKNVTWSLDYNTDVPNTCTLTISGTGAMDDYNLGEGDYKSSSWYEWGYYQKITHIKIEEGVTSIGNYAFSSCTALKSIEIPNTVTSIGSDAFRGCLVLQSVTLPNNVTSIGDRAFYNCRQLPSITIPDSVQTIGENAFNNCNALTRISIPEGVTSIDNGVFNSCTSLENINIPSSVKTIGDYAFADCSALTSITIPGTVNTIGNYAFVRLNLSNYSSLTSVNILEGVQSIGSNAFQNCSSLTAINIPSSVTSIGASAFNGCSQLANISIPDGVTSIGDSTFQDCSQLANISIPDGVTSIGDSTFQDCSQLANISIPDGVQSIGSNAFRDCSSLTDINLPNSLTSFGTETFRKCTSLKSIEIPDGILSISSWAFYDCSSLTTIELPDSVEEIGEEAFRNCSSLTTIDLPDGVEGIGAGAFRNCSSLMTIDLPNSIKTIGERAFYDCSSLTTVKLPDNVETIGDYAFRGCASLTSIEIPSTVTSIGIWAFSRCTALKTIIFMGDAPEFVLTSAGNGTCFSGVTATAYYPVEKDGWTDEIKQDYSGTIQWVKGFTVSFETSGGSTIKSQLLTDGKAATKPSAPTRSGYQFSGWFTDETYETEYNFDTPVTDTMTLYAKWTKICTVSFETNGGSTIESQQVAEGNTAAKPDDPTRSGYRFSGWYTDETYQTEYDFDTIVTDTMTLYAKWTKISSGSTGSSSTTTETSKNPDGSTTTTVTDKKTGTVTETTKGTDGSTLVVVTEANGAVTTTQTTPEQVVVKTVDQPGQAVTATVTIPAQEKTATVTIPATAVTPGTVAKNADTGEIVKRSVPTEDGLLVTLEASANLVLVDNSKDFADTDHHWAQDAIDFVTARGMFHGTSATTFSPESSMTRGMLAVVLHNFEGNPDQSFSHAFSDVSDGDWYADGIRWAASLGIVDGYGNGAFGAQDDLTREQLVTILYRYARAMGYDTTGSAPLTTFPDSAALSPYATDAMSWAVATGLITGMDDNTLTPQGTATRAQVATILMRFCTNLTK